MPPRARRVRRRPRLARRARRAPFRPRTFKVRRVMKVVNKKFIVPIANIVQFNYAASTNVSLTQDPNGIYIQIPAQGNAAFGSQASLSYISSYVNHHFEDIQTVITNYTNVFDRYRIRAVGWKLLNNWNTSGTTIQPAAGPNAAFLTNPPSVTMFDYQDIGDNFIYPATPAGKNQIMTWDRVRTTTLGRQANMKRFYRTRPQISGQTTVNGTNIPTGTTGPFTGPTNFWIDNEFVQIDHQGSRIFLEINNALAVPYDFWMNIMFTYYMQFKDMI